VDNSRPGKFEILNQFPERCPGIAFELAPSVQPFQPSRKSYTVHPVLLDGGRYKIVAHFEAQTYQPAKPLIKCYFIQI
jgi:hypothetical protein